jgi:hypothetical protein
MFGLVKVVKKDKEKRIDAQMTINKIKRKSYLNQIRELCQKLDGCTSRPEQQTVPVNS